MAKELKDEPTYLHIRKRNGFAIVDKKGNIIETFRLKAAANNFMVNIPLLERKDMKIVTTK